MRAHQYETSSDVIERYQRKGPVDIEGLAMDLGLKVFETDDWDDGVSGAIFKNEDDSYSIYVNGKHPRVRRRFTIAHEVAHFLLHRDLIGDGLTDNGLYRSRLSNTYEVQANRMAASLLMPWHLINELMIAGVRDVSTMAKSLDVSELALKIQLGIPV